VLIQGITLRQSQFWQVHPTLCRNVTIDSVTTGDTANHNTDACDVDCCYNVVVKHCAFDGADDSIAIKSGLDDDGRRVNTPSQNIVIYRCRVQGVGAAVACGSDTTGGIRNVYAFGVETFGRSTLYMLNVKSNTHRGGYVRNVNLDSCRGDSLGGPWLFAEMNYQDHEYLSASYPPKFEDWTVSNASGDSDPVILVFTGLPGDEIRNVVVTDSNFTNIRSPHNVYEHVTGVVLRNVTINGVPASS
jgi:hypothetical protein